MGEINKPILTTYSYSYGHVVMVDWSDLRGLGFICQKHCCLRVVLELAKYVSQLRVEFHKLDRQVDDHTDAAHYDCRDIWVPLDTDRHTAHKPVEHPKEFVQQALSLRPKRRVLRILDIIILVSRKEVMFVNGC